MAPMTEEERREQAEKALEVTAQDMLCSKRRILGYAKPYQELLVRSEQEESLIQMLVGLTSGLERKSIEPIAVMHGVPRRGLQRFVGMRGWKHEPLIQQLRSEVAAEIGAEDAAVVVDGSSTPKKGDATVGVGRQWCGRLGKVDNCVIGVYGVYVGQQESAALVGAELYLPEAWTADPERRESAYVPEEVEYCSQPEIASGIVSELAGKMPFAWVLGDDEFGRAKHFRDAVRELGKSYVLDVPSNTSVCRRGKDGQLCIEQNVEDLTSTRPVREWSYVKVRDGSNGPIEVRVLRVEVATARARGAWVEESLLVIETLDASQRWYCLASCPSGTPTSELVRQAGRRHRVEEVFEETKGEVGLDHFEVRSWHGWYHHMTLCQIAHWFLVREKRRLGKKISRRHRQPDPIGHRSSPVPATLSAAGSRLHQLPPHPEPRGPGSPLPRRWSLSSSLGAS